MRKLAVEDPAWTAGLLGSACITVNGVFVKGGRTRDAELVRTEVVIEDDAPDPRSNRTAPPYEQHERRTDDRRPKPLPRLGYHRTPLLARRWIPPPVTAPTARAACADSNRRPDRDQRQWRPGHRPDTTGPHQFAYAGKPCTPPAGSSMLGRHALGAVQFRALQSGTVELRAPQVGTAKVAMTQVDEAKVCVPQIRLPKVGTRNFGCP